MSWQMPTTMSSPRFSAGPWCGATLASPHKEEAALKAEHKRECRAIGAADQRPILAGCGKGRQERDRDRESIAKPQAAGMKECWRKSNHMHWLCCHR